MSNSILVTGFESFNNHKDNMSSKILSKIPLEVSGGITKKLILPVLYQTAGEIVLNFLNDNTPDYIIMLGERENINSIQLEKNALNLRFSNKRDNNGNLIKQQKIIYNAVTKIPTNIDIDKYAKKYNKNISESAGTFVCNDVFYQVAYKLWDSDTKYIFIHVPADANYLDKSLTEILHFMAWIQKN